MKLLFVSHMFPPHALGGYEYNCRDMALVMREMGHQVDVITSTYGVERPVREPNVWRVLKLSSDYGTTEQHRSGVGRGRFDVDVHNSRALSAELKRVMPDATMMWGAGNLGPLPAWVAEGHGPTVYELGDEWLLPLLQPQARAPIRRWGRRLYRSLLGISDRPLRADNLVFVSRALAERYRSQGARFDRHRINYVGIDPEMFTPQEQAIMRSAAVRRILFTGRVAPAKGTTTLLRAFARLQRNEGVPKTQLTLVGPSTREYTTELWTIAEQEGVRDKVSIPGPVTRSALPQLYAEHDVFAFPSEWLEPFAMTPIEAMACCIPVVSSLAGGSTELVRDHDNAVAFKAGDAGDLADKLAWMLTHRDEAAAMARRASEEARSKYTLRRQAEGLLEAISEVMNVPGPRMAAV